VALYNTGRGKARLRPGARFFVPVVSRLRDGRRKVEEKTRTRLRSERLRRGMTMREAAKHAGVSLEVIDKWEQGHHTPRSDHAIKVADAFGLDFDDLAHDFGIRRVPRGKGVHIA
jgi:DNA-binding XRE family transcriptional regulator